MYAMVLTSPKQTVSKTINKIGKGRGSNKLVNSLTRTLNENPGLIRGATYQLVDIIKSEKNTLSGFVFDALLNIAEIDPGPLKNVSETLVKIIQHSDDRLDIPSTLKAMDILSIVTIGYPDQMQPYIPVLFNKIHHPSGNVRSASYFMLDTIAKSRPEYFLDYTPDLVKCLHGLNNDERIYGIRLIGEIATDYPDIFDEFCNTLHVLAYNYPSMEVRTAAYDVFHRFKLPEKKDEEDLHEFEKDFIGQEDIASDNGDFEMVADELSRRIQGIDFESSAVDLLTSMGMGHLIVKPDSVGSEVHNTGQESVEQIHAEPEPLKKMPPKPEPDDEFPELELQRIECMLADPVIKSRMSVLKNISEFEAEHGPREPDDTSDEQLSEISKVMIQLIISELSEEEWVIHVDLTTKNGTVIAASDPASLDEQVRKRIYEMLNLEGAQRLGFRNRVSIELPTKQLMALVINSDYVLITATKTDIQFGMVLYELTKAAEKIETILK